jgi:hypothetical protein
MTDFVNLIMEMRGGAVATDLNNKFNEMLTAVLETGGKGELTVKIKAAPSKMGMGGCVLEVETEHECKMKKPELSVGKAFFFVTKDGELTRDDPAQTAMFQLDQQEAKQERKN